MLKLKLTSCCTRRQTRLPRSRPPLRLKSLVDGGSSEEEADGVEAHDAAGVVLPNISSASCTIRLLR